MYARGLSGWALIWRAVCSIRGYGLCSSGDIHYYDSTDRESVIQLVIFNPQLISSPGGWPKEVRLIDPFICTGGVDQAVLANSGMADIPRLMLQLERELNGELPHYEQVITGQLNELCGLLLRHLPSEPADQKKTCGG